MVLIKVFPKNQYCESFFAYLLGYSHTDLSFYCGAYKSSLYILDTSPLLDDFKIFSAGLYIISFS